MVVTSRFLFPRHISKPLVLGPLHMSPVTRLARLPGPILLSVHMGNFSPVDRDEIQETKPKWWTYTCIVLGFRSCVNSSNFTYKANLHTPKVEIHTRQKLCHFGCYVAKAKLFCLKVASRLSGLECSYGRIFIPVTEISFAKTDISVNGPARLPI